MRKALITGASSGIGRDIARLLASRGWEVILVARRADKLMSLKKELGKNAKCIRCDVSHEPECRKLYDVLKDEMKAIHLETARLLIRNYIDTDEDGYLTIFQDEKSMAMDGDKVIMKKNDIFYHRIAMIKDRELVFLSLADKVNNSFIGYVLLNKYPEEQNDAITLGCSLVPEYQSKGYGFEALKGILSELKNSMVVKRILANAYVYNKPSLGLINKLGFTSIGTKDNEEFFILDI